ncbi:MAG: response regulator [Paenibacillaceae bacterium]|nr:response regulator [Paenibacillaceae bacterium]
MITMLVVDDERVAVQGITRGIDWSDTPIRRLLEAYDVAEAIELLQSEQVDVLITDIEMPVQSGIKLLEWVHEFQPEIKTILLTGHADFHYAQRALQLGSFEYVLKPVRHIQLKEIAMRAAGEWQEEQELATSSERYKAYAEQWERQKPALLERFWQDVMADRTALTEALLDTAISLYELDPQARQGIVPVLISVEQWSKKLSMRDEEILEFALRNTAAELFAKLRSGNIIQDYRSGSLFALLYGNADEWLPEESGRLRDECLALMDVARSHFYCTVSCYIGEPTAPDSLADACKRLQKLERENITASQAVIWEREALRQEPGPAVLPWLPDWLVLFETGKQADLLLRLDRLFDELRREGQVTFGHLRALGDGLLYLMAYALHKRGLALHHEPPEEHIAEAGPPIRSLEQWHRYLRKRIAETMELLALAGKDDSGQIAKVKRFIADHLGAELTREMIAGNVFLNPAYLSRLFKKETGLSLSDYILQRRIETSKQLLTDTPEKITSIVAAVGFQNNSYFTKMFKKTVGVTPQEYRKRYRQE